MRRAYSLFAVGVCLCILSAQTHGTLITTLSFENITQNDAIAAATAGHSETRRPCQSNWILWFSGCQVGVQVAEVQ
jgi:hypothetical protein